MRMNAARAAVRASFSLTILLMIGAAVALVLLLVIPGALDPLALLTDNTWWFRYAAPSAGDLDAVWRIGAAILCAGLSLGGSLRAYALFKKSSSPILPFLMLTFLSLALECLRGGTALLFSADASISVSIVLTRIIYWGRFLGLIGLLIAGLLCIEMKYRRYSVLVGLAFLTAFAMAAYIPMDRTLYLAQLTWKLGDEQGIWFVSLLIAILAAGTTALAAVVRRMPVFLWLTVGFLLLLAAREILFFATNPVLLGAGLVAEGLAIFACLRVVSVLYRRIGDMAAF
jgi:hypothetical protein